MQKYLKPYDFLISFSERKIYEGLWMEIHLNSRQKFHYKTNKTKQNQKPKKWATKKIFLNDQTKNKGRARDGEDWLEFWNIMETKEKENVRRNGIMNNVKYHREFNKIK